MKRILLFSSIVAALGLIIWTVFQLKERHQNSFPVQQFMPKELDMIVEIRNTEASLEILETLPGWDQTYWMDGYKSFCQTLSSFDTPVTGHCFFGIKNSGSQWIAVAPIQLVNSSLEGTIMDYNGHAVVQRDDLFYVQDQEFFAVANALALLQSALDNTSNHPLLEGVAYDAANDIALSIYTAWENGDQLLLEPQRMGETRLLNGVILPADSSRSRWKQFPIRPYPLNQIALPASSKAFEIRDYNNAMELFNSIDLSRKNSNEEYFWNQAWAAISDSCQCSVFEIATSWQGPQRANFIIAADSSDAPVSAFSLADTTNLQVLFDPVVSPFGNIFRISYPEVFRKYQDDLFLCNYEYLWYNNSTVYFSDSPSALEKTRSEILGNQLFFYETLMNPEVGGITLYGGRYLTALFPESLTWLFMNSEKGNGTVLRSDSQHLLFQWHPNALQKATASQPVAAKPEEETSQAPSWSVINHNTNEKEQLRNDGKILALYSSTNEKLWSIELDGAVLGQVTQIDLFQNGKLQLAFTTAKSLYVIDRNGKNVPGFPLIYNKGITSGLCVADYDNNRNYRLLFGTADGSIQNINNSGKATPGWQYTGDKPVSSIEVKKNQNQSEIWIRFEDGTEKKLKRNGTTS